jgi:putative transposase
LHGINPLERLNGEIKRRNEAVGAILLDQNDEWAVRRARTVTLETIGPASHNSLVSLPAAGA